MTSWIPTQFYLEQLVHGAPDRLNVLLPPIGEAIQREILQIESLAATDDDDDDRYDYHQTVVDEACENIEDLLGVAFVVTQNAISRGVSFAHDLEHAARLNEKMSAGELRRLGRPIQGSPSTSQIELIHALGNYFKHGDEWPSNWDHANGRQADTVKVLRLAGLTPNSTGNFRSAAEVLGLRPYSGVVVMRDIVADWTREAGDLYARKVEHPPA